MDDWRFAAWCRSLSSDASSSRLVHQDYAPRKHDEPHKSRRLCHLANSSLSPRSHYVALFSTLSSVFKKCPSATLPAYSWQTFCQSYICTDQTSIKSAQATTRNLVLS
ncbi:Uncharacterized protein HZ326_27755 [Fusarium oxysporum f. sp. albedinis]|nr:Uncharacterized protein HZ326_27755 [Fusarium oxysporum f. sp. albedinis]